MATESNKLYEALFLLSQQEVANDFAGCVQHVRDIFARAEAELLVLRKWDERRLAYEIKGQKRGTYLLAYFKIEGAKISSIERDCDLSEQILRVLIIKADHVGQTELDLARRDQDATLEGRLRGAASEDQAPAPPVAAATAGDPK
jgi:small subunit ribosomal protein S6